MSFMVITNCVLNIFNNINNLKLFYLILDTFFQQFLANIILFSL